MRLTFIKGEQKLVKDCLRGLPAAQKEFYDRFASTMMAVCMRYSRDRMEAEDILQEGFIRVFDNLKSFKFEGSLEGWVRRIIVNVAIRHYQRNTRLYVVTDLDAAENQPGQEMPDGHLHYQQLLDMVQSLPDGYRVVFNLYAIEGYSHAEIADLLEISEVTSRSQFARARKTLMRMVTETAADRPALAGNEATGR